MEVYGYDSVVKSHCRMCHGGCGVLVYVKDGKIAKIAGDPECPINHGTLCSKGWPPPSSSITRTGSPILSKGWGPRQAANGSGSPGMRPWTPSQSESWPTKKSSDPSPSFSDTGPAAKMKRSSTASPICLGSPNVLTAGHFCYGPRISTSILTCGTNPIVDYENFPKCIMMWGNNVVISNPDWYKGEPFSVALDHGAKLIVVDPRLTRAAARADIWLPLRPGHGCGPGPGDGPCHRQRGAL